MTKKAKKKSWYTVAWLTREGAPHPAHRQHNFTQTYATLDMVTADLAYAIVHMSLGAYAAVVWPGQVSEWVALHTNLKPVCQILEGGFIQKIP
jgi:hypothetical protein